jgi:predicted Zn-dependent protease
MKYRRKKREGIPKSFRVFMGCLGVFFLGLFIYLQFIYPAILEKKMKETALSSFQSQFKSDNIVRPDVLDLARVMSYALSNQIEDSSYQFELSIECINRMNAFTLPGGDIVILSEILKNVKTQSALAMLLGHEMSHNLHHHFRSRIRRQVWLKFGWQSFFGGSDSDSDGVFLSLFQVIAESPFSMDEEIEADKLGLELVYKAGYDVDEAVKLYDVLGKGYMPVFFSTHPNPNKRKEILENYIQENSWVSPKRETENLPDIFSDPCIKKPSESKPKTL